MLQLESDLSHRSDELRNEKLTSQNMAQTLAAAQEKIKLGELEARDLQVNLESLSRTSDSHNSRSAKLERDKSTLEARVRELEVNLRQLSSPPSVPKQRTGPRPRSSSLSSFRITALQRELKEAGDSLSQKENDLQAAKQSLSQARSDLLRVGNEKEAVERKATREQVELKSSLEQKEDELQYWKEQQDNGRREEELMKRVEEDEAKITMLEKLLGDTQESPKLKESKEKLEKAEEKLNDERKRRSGYEERHVELVKEKEDALDQLEHVRDELSRLSADMASRKCELELFLFAEYSRSMVFRNALNADVAIIDASIEQPFTLPPMPQEAVTHIERLLVAIERLRGERDNLQRDMHFLESESKFAIDALKAKLAASPSSSIDDEAESAKTIFQLQTEIDALRDQLTTATVQREGIILAKDKHIEQLVLAATASAVAVEHLQSQSDHLQHRFFETCHSRAEVKENLKSSQKYAEELEVKLEVTVLCLEATTSQQNDVMTQLAAKDAKQQDEVREVKSALRETRDCLEQAEMDLANVSKTLEGVESERDSLALQITNLSTDLRVAQEDLATAEDRYSSLQSHQLSSMSSNEATRLLQDQIEELEMRVMRRTEQIGIHQHDIKRLETNLRLQEERLGEMTTELEMMAAQKDAMVEDCADAREARDETLARLDRLEMDMEMRIEESDNVAAALVAVVFETVSHSRDTFRQSNARVSKAEEELDRLNAARQHILDQNSILLDALRSSDDHTTQSTLALAVSHAALQSARTCIRTMRNVKNTQGDLLEERRKAASLRKQLEDLESQTSKDALDFSVRTSELEAQIIGLQDELSSAEVAHHAAVNELLRSQERLKKSTDVAQRSHVDGSPENELTLIKARHAEELEDVQSRLVETSAVLKELQAHHASAETKHHQAFLHASETKQELERRLAQASESLHQEKQQADQVQKEALAELSRLHGDLDVALTNAQNARDSREELQTLYDRVSNELAQVRQDHETRFASLTDQSLAIRQELEGKIADLQSRFDKQSSELDNALQETRQVAQRLQESLKQLSAAKESHQKELHSVDQIRHNAESALGQHHREMSIVKGQLEQVRIDLETLQEEKLSLHQEITTLEAEFQRSISLRRFLESQAQDRFVIFFSVVYRTDDLAIVNARSRR